MVLPECGSSRTTFDEMIIPISVKELSVAGKSFKWVHPSCCSGCGNSKVWGHGFVRKYFEGFANGVFLKRYRCPACRKVVTAYPDNYWRRYQSSKFEIASILKHRLDHKAWPRGSPRQRAGHWLRKLTSFLKLHFGMGVCLSPELIDWLCEKNLPFLSV